MQIDEALLGRSREDLLCELGRGVADISLGSKSKNRMDFIFDALAWLSQNRALFVEKICRSPVIEVIREHERTANRLALVSAIADLICQSCGKAPVATVSLLLADEGLHALCGTGYSESEESAEGK